MNRADCRIKITVVYDKSSCQDGLETGWGFCAYIVGGEKNLLFDAGPGDCLLRNMKKLKIDPSDVDTVVLSHFHPDHTGGLKSFLKVNHNVTVYLPNASPMELKDNITGPGAKMIEVERSLEICKNVYTTGQVGTRTKEQSLVVRTQAGLIVLVGCGHPGIVEIVTAAKHLCKDDLLLVIGGFHLEWATKGRLEKVTSAFRSLGLRYVGPGHCSTDKTKTLLRERFGQNYIEISAGKTIRVTDLQ
jgi:7,8-dihydropterin-6-yl-methyl-4-(beta-D-ribofuranosyl)aminobenzene 5'-phosphate synthase